MSIRGLIFDRHICTEPIFINTALANNLAPIRVWDFRELGLKADMRLSEVSNPIPCMM